jgi:hypothetical protein
VRLKLLEGALRASGGLDRWRQLRRFTVHLSIRGELCGRVATAAKLQELVVEGSTLKQELKITGFTAADRRALYRPDWVAVEGSDGRRLKERPGSPAEFRSRSSRAPGTSCNSPTIAAL